MKISKSPLSWQQLILLTVSGINLMVLLMTFSIWQTMGDRALSFLSNLFKLQPVELQIDNSTLIVERLQNLQELTTTVQTMEKIVPTSAQRKLGDIPLGTTRLLYLATGQVRAGVDLSELTRQDIYVDRNNNIEINLPTAKILDSKIDVNHSRVYDYDRGFLNLGPDVAPQLQTLAQRDTLTEIVDTACKTGILDTANLKAQESVSYLLTNIGYSQVKVNTSLPDFCGTVIFDHGKQQG